MRSWKLFLVLLTALLCLAYSEPLGGSALTKADEGRVLTAQRHRGMRKKTIAVCQRQKGGEFLKRRIPRQRFRKQRKNFKLPGSKLAARGQFLNRRCKKVNCQKKCQNRGRCFRRYRNFRCVCKKCGRNPKPKQPKPTTTTKAPLACPARQPSPGDACPVNGASCDYGRETCCGETFPSFSVSR